MKNLLIGLLLGLCVSLATASAFREFGPVQTKAMIKVIVAEFNRNRDWHGKPHITEVQVRDELKAAVDAIDINTDPDFDWMRPRE